MNTYKITNITNFIGKRDTRFNSVLDIEYVDSMVKKTIKINPGESVYLQISSLPLSVHGLRVKKLINVTEVSVSELKNSMASSKPITTQVNRVEEKTETDTSAKKKVTIKKPQEIEPTEQI